MVLADLRSSLMQTHIERMLFFSFHFQHPLLPPSSLLAPLFSLNNTGHMGGSLGVPEECVCLRKTIVVFVCVCVCVCVRVCDPKIENDI